MPAGNDTYLTDMDIRIWLRDKDPAANLLMDDFEFGTEEIRTASTLAVDYWNETPPPICVYDEVYRFPFRYHLLMATCANLFFIAANLYRRNKLAYQVPGGGISDQNKDAEYDGAGQRLWEQYKAWVASKKKEINIEQGFGII